MELLARFATGEEVEEYKERGYKPLSGGSDIFVPPVKLQTDETVSFKLSKFLWNSMIEMKGIRVPTI